jgi:hypothetical protein
VFSSRKHWLLLLLSVFLLSALIWAAVTPITFTSREEVFEIPKDTWARRMAGNKVEILPNNVYLTLGIKDILLLRNMDDVPQIFGPTLMMPGQSFRLPFALASRYEFACTAHTSGQMVIVVDPEPNSLWQRLVWRTRTFYRMIKSKLL